MLVYLHNSDKCPPNTRTYSFLTHGYLTRLQYCILYIEAIFLPLKWVLISEQTVTPITVVSRLHRWAWEGQNSSGFENPYHC